MLGSSYTRRNAGRRRYTCDLIVAVLAAAAGASVLHVVIPQAKAFGISAGLQRRARMLTPSTTRPTLTSTGLCDISEWRDIMFDLDVENFDVSDGKSNFNDSPPREVCVLPFPFEDVLLQGETKELRLYEDRFISLFDDAVSSGVVAMGLLAENGIIQTVPLCEIEAYNRMDGFGIFVTIRVVSRAALLDVTKDTPYIKAVCKELVDEVPQEKSDRELLDIVAGNIEITLVTLSAMEHRLKERLRETDGKIDASIYGDEDDDDDDNDEDDELDRTGRFRAAFQIAKNFDTSGYISVSEEDSSQRSVQDLAAISWAAFQTDRLNEDGGDVAFVADNGQLLATSDVLFRMQALAASDLSERLKLASQYLRHKKAQLKESLEKAGVNYEDGGDGLDL